MSSKLSFYEYLEFTSLVAICVTGIYQIFFWVQRNNYYFKTKCWKIKLDDYIPFWPKWVWIYSLLYYVMIGYVIVSIQSIEQGVHLIFAGLILTIIQSIFFITYPCRVPTQWREYKADTISKKFLRFIQGVDNGRNCVPSMHCSVATLVGLVLVPVISWYAYVFIGLIAISCVFVKQHQILDLLPGVLLGWLVYLIVLA